MNLNAIKISDIIVIYGNETNKANDSFTPEPSVTCVPPYQCIDCNDEIHTITQSPCNCSNIVCSQGCGSLNPGGGSNQSSSSSVIGNGNFTGYGGTITGGTVTGCVTVGNTTTGCVIVGGVVTDVVITDTNGNTITGGTITDGVTTGCVTTNGVTTGCVTTGGTVIGGVLTTSSSSSSSLSSNSYSCTNLLAWGAGKTDVPGGAESKVEFGQCIIPADALSGVTQIAGGVAHTIALKGGAVLAWGLNLEGQCTVPASANSGVTQIASGSMHTIALKAGAVLAWGYNAAGQCTVPASANSGVTQIASGAGHTVALKDGRVLAWGYNEQGQCNIPAAAQSGVTAIAGGESHTIALKDGAVLAWGYNFYGQCNIPAAAQSGVTAIAGGGDHTIALKDGAVLAWGRNFNDELNVPYAAKSGVIAIACGDKHSVALKSDGSVIAWGDNDSRQCTITLSALSGVTAIACGGYHTLAIDCSSSSSSSSRCTSLCTGVKYWGASAWDWPDPMPDSGNCGVTAIAAGDFFVMGLKDGGVIAWSEFGDLRSTVPDVAKIGVTAIAAGTYQALALKNGGVLAWGKAQHFENLYKIPYSAQFDVIAIACGAEHNLALKSDGTVIAWGGSCFARQCIGTDEYGQGSDDVNSLGIPVKIMGKVLTGVIAIAAGDYFSAALKNNGEVVTWGDFSGRWPVPNAALSGVTAIAAGGYHILAIKNGEVLQWGADLTEHNTQANRIPTSGKSEVIAIAAGPYHNIALRSDGTLISWGQVPCAGDLSGDDTTTWTTGTFSAIAAGYNFTVAIGCGNQPISCGTNFTSTPPQFTAKVLTGCTPPVKCIDCNGIIHQIPSAPCNCTNPVCYEGCSSSSTAGVYCNPPYYCTDCYGVTHITRDPPCTDLNPVCQAGCSSSSSSRSSSSSSSSLNSSSSSNNTTITIVSVSPNKGPTTGGTPIALSGTNFTGINNLKIGGTAATNVNVENANSITATTPPGTIGLKDIEILGPTVGSFTKINAFEYIPLPIIQSVAPGTGPTAGGTNITITGSYFTGASNIKIGDTLILSPVVGSDSIITGITQPGAGLKSCSVTTIGGTTTEPEKFLYTDTALPTIVSVAPSSGTTLGGTPITITGTLFTGTTSVKVGTTNATEPSVNIDGTQITCKTPAGTGTKGITVTATAGTGVLSNAFTYVTPPTINTGGVTPKEGPTTGGTVITIRGTNLSGTSSVTVGGNTATTIIIVSATQITAVTPPGQLGAKDVVVTTGGGSVTSTGAFTYISGPTITLISPDNGSVLTETPITITGTGFITGTTVLVNTSPLTLLSIVNSTTITGKTPALTEGEKVVTLTNAGGTAISAFTYKLQPPVISSLSPVSGPKEGGTSVTITGTNFVGVSSIKFGDQFAVNPVVVVSPIKITCVSPAHGLGKVNVVVTTSAGTGTKTDGYEYTSTPIPKFDHIAVGRDITAGIIMGTGKVMVWGKEGASWPVGTTGITNVGSGVPNDALKDVIRLHMSPVYNNIVATKSDGRLISWGYYWDPVTTRLTVLNGEEYHYQNQPDTDPYRITGTGPDYTSSMDLNVNKYYAGFGVASVQPTQTTILPAGPHSIVITNSLAVSNSANIQNSVRGWGNDSWNQITGEDYMGNQQNPICGGRGSTFRWAGFSATVCSSLGSPGWNYRYKNNTSGVDWSASGMTVGSDTLRTYAEFYSVFSSNPVEVVVGSNGVDKPGYTVVRMENGTVFITSLTGGGCAQTISGAYRYYTPCYAVASVLGGTCQKIAACNITNAPYNLGTIVKETVSGVTKYSAGGINVPTPLINTTFIISDISCGRSYTLVVFNGTAYGWNHTPPIGGVWQGNEYGQASGTPEDATAGKTVKINGVSVTNVKNVIAGDVHSTALKNDGTIVRWGDVNPNLTNTNYVIKNYVAPVLPTVISTNLNSVINKILQYGNRKLNTTINTQDRGGREYAGYYDYSRDFITETFTKNWLGDLYPLPSLENQQLTVVQKEKNKPVITWRHNGFSPLVIGEMPADVLTQSNFIKKIECNKYSCGALISYDLNNPLDQNLRLWPSQFLPPSTSDRQSGQAVVDFSISETHVAVIVSGYVFAWGSNLYGACTGASNWVALNPACGFGSNPTPKTCTVFGGSEGGCCQLVNGDARMQYAKPYGTNQYYYADLVDCKLVACGINKTWVITQPSTQSYGSLYENGDGKGTVKITSTGEYLFASGENVAVWIDPNGRLGGGTYLKNAVSVAAGSNHTLALTSEGKVYGFGRNNEGQCSGTTIVDKINANWKSGTPVKINGVILENVSKIFASGNSSYALLTNGVLISWGAITDGDYNRYDSGNQRKYPQTSGFLPPNLFCTSENLVSWGPNTSSEEWFKPNNIMITAGQAHACRINEYYNIECWGAGTTMSDVLNPDIMHPSGFEYGQSIIPNSLGTILSKNNQCISAGIRNTVAIQELENQNYGKVFSWGFNNYGQSSGYNSNGYIINTSENYYNGANPVQIYGKDLDEVVSISTGSNYSIALKNNGTVVGWGRNDHGQCLGTNDKTNITNQTRGTPITTSLGYGNTPPLYVTYKGIMITGANAVSAGNKHACASVNGGSEIKCWGNKTSLPNDYCVQPPEISELITNYPVISIACGKEHTCALLTTGFVACWGFNDYGQLDIPNDYNNNIDYLTCRNNTCFAVQTNGTVISWGEDIDGIRTNTPNTQFLEKTEISIGGGTELIDYHEAFVVAKNGICSGSN